MTKMTRPIKEILRWAWTISIGIRWRIIVVTLLGIFNVLIGLAFIWASKWTIDIATNDASGNLWMSGIVLILLVLIQLSMGVVQNWFSIRLQVHSRNQLRHRLFQRLLASRWNELEQYHSGDVVNRVQQDGSVIINLLTSTVPAFVITATQLSAAFIFFCFLDIRLAWILVALLPILLIGSRYYSRRMRKYTHTIRQSGSNIQSVLQESLQHRVVIKSMEQDDRHLDKLESLQTGLEKQVDVRTRFSLFSRSIVSLGFSGGYLIAFLWGAYRLSLGTISFGTITAMLQLVSKVQQPALSLSKLIPSFVIAMTAAERLMELEDLPSEDLTKQQLYAAAPRLIIDHVFFKYKEGTPEVMDGLDVTIEPGSRCAIIGETGAGKTTLIRLILAFATPDKGSILLESTDAQHLPTNSDSARISLSSHTRCNFVYVPQGNSLLSGTIRDNLLMGNSQATDQEMITALRHAQADFVLEMSNGLDTSINELGGGLSEGQAQRIAIARALLRPGQILLLDEATSALDSETERHFLDALDEYYPNKTVLFITHDQSIVERANQVITLSRR